MRGRPQTSKYNYGQKPYRCFVTVWVNTEDVNRLDQLVGEGHFKSRSDAVRQAIEKAFISDK